MTARIAATRIVPLAIMAVTAGLLLSACTVTANLTVPASEVARTAETALEEELGRRPSIDCGEEAVALRNGTKVDCVLTDPVTGEKFDAPVTLSDVDGSDFTVNVQVADAPIGGSTSEPDPSEVPIPDDAPIVSGTALAEVVVTALSQQLSYPPVVVCNMEIAIVVGNTAGCLLTDDAGKVHDVNVTVTAFDGETYEINAKVLN